MFGCLATMNVLLPVQRSSRFCGFGTEQVLEGHLWEALWPYMSVPEILQVRTSAQPWNEASNCGLCCELSSYEERTSER